MISYQDLNALLAQLGGLSPDMIIAGVGLLLVAALYLYHYKLQRDSRREAQAAESARLKTMSRLVELQRAEVERLQERLQMLENYVEQLNGRQQRFFNSASQHKQRLDDAIAIAGRGLDDRELASRSGINPSEARLIASLYNNPAPI